MFIQLYGLKSMTLSNKQKFHASSNQMIDCLSLLHHYPFHWKRSFGAYEGKLIAVNQRPFDRDYYNLCTDVPPSSEKNREKKRFFSRFFFLREGRRLYTVTITNEKKSHVKHVKISFSASLETKLWGL